MSTDNVKLLKYLISYIINYLITEITMNRSFKRQVCKTENSHGEFTMLQDIIAAHTNFFNGLSNTNLIVDGHDRDKHCVWSEGFLQYLT